MGTDATGPAAVASVLLGALAELLAELDDQQVSDILSGRARLAVVPVADPEPAQPPPHSPPRPPSPTPLPAAPGAHPTRAPRRTGGTERAPRRSRPEPLSTPALEDLRRSLREAPSREAAELILDGLGPFTVTALRELAAGLGVTGVGSRDPRSAVLRKIVDGTVGQRLRSEAIFAEGSDDGYHPGIVIRTAV